MSALSPYDSALNRMRGGIATYWGQTYDVYRLNSSTNDSISSNPPIISNFKARIRRTTEKIEIENAYFDILLYEAECDASQLELGDVLVQTTQTGLRNDESIFTFAQARPSRKTLFVRTESTVSLSRPMPMAGQAAQQPVAGNVATPGWSGFWKTSEQNLILKNGSYSFSSVSGSSPATVYAGLQPTPRMRDSSHPKIPTAMYREEYVLWVPMLPGEALTELDRISFPNSDRYEVAVIYTSDQTGLSGYILKTEKLPV